MDSRALVQKGSTDGDRRLIEALPEVLSTTRNASVPRSTSRTTAAGINMDAILALGTCAQGRGRAAPAITTGSAVPLLVIFANAPTDNPFMAGRVPTGR